LNESGVIDIIKNYSSKNIADIFTKS